MPPKEIKNNEPEFDFNELFTEPEEGGLKDILPWISVAISAITLVVVMIK